MPLAHLIFFEEPRELTEAQIEEARQSGLLREDTAEAPTSRLPRATPNRRLSGTGTTPVTGGQARRQNVSATRSRAAKAMLTPTPSGTWEETQVTTTQTPRLVQFVADGAGFNLTSALAAPTQTTLIFANTGREMLFVAAGAVSETVTVDVGALVDGQTVSNFTTVNLTNSDTYAFGPFHSVIDQNGTNQVQIVLSTTTSITVALIQTVGVY